MTDARIKQARAAAERTHAYLTTALACDIRTAGHYVGLAAESAREAYDVMSEIAGVVRADLSAPKVNHPTPGRTK